MACSGTIEHYDPGGRYFRFYWELRAPNGLMVPINCHPQHLEEFPYEGIDFAVWDFDCDGWPDFARDPGGRWYRVRPIVASAGPLDWGQDDGGLDVEIDVDQPFDEPLDFPFGDLTASQWIAEMGLDASVGEQIETSLLGLSVDLETWHTELLMPWRSGLHLPNSFSFDGQFEMDALLSDGDGPAFMVIRLGGDFVDVVNYLLRMTAGPLGAELEDARNGQRWSLRANPDSATATVSLEGLDIVHIPLD